MSRVRHRTVSWTTAFRVPRASDRLLLYAHDLSHSGAVWHTHPGEDQPHVHLERDHSPEVAAETHRHENPQVHSHDPAEHEHRHNHQGEHGHEHGHRNAEHDAHDDHEADHGHWHVVAPVAENIHPILILVAGFTWMVPEQESAAPRDLPIKLSAALRL